MIRWPRRKPTKRAPRQVDTDELEREYRAILFLCRSELGGTDRAQRCAMRTWWSTCQDNGLLMLKFERGVWPFEDSTAPPGLQN
jgi:hypothetical protein